MCAWREDPEAVPQKDCGKAAVTVAVVHGVRLPPNAGFALCVDHVYRGVSWVQDTYGDEHVQMIGISRD